MVLLSSCATQPAPTKPIGDIPKNYHQSAKAAVRARLKNPFDVKEVKVSSPITIVYDYNQAPKWTVCVSLYARNGFNAYVPGAYYVAFDGDRVVKVVSIDDYGFIKSQSGKCWPMSPTSWS